MEKIDNRQPWKIKDNKELQGFLEEIVKGILNVNNKIKPFMSETAEKIENTFNSSKIKLEKPLFPRIKVEN